MKKMLCLIAVLAMLCFFAVELSAQIVLIGQSSEWEATGFNNGRRVVRDCMDPDTGYYHYVWHSQPNPYTAPSGSGCDIYYACTDFAGNVVVNPTNLTLNLGFTDNRYPSIAIEYYILDGTLTYVQFNNIHLVWQATSEEEGTIYEIYHAVINVTGPPTVPPPFTPANVKNLSQTPNNESLVPAIAINQNNEDGFQHVHVVWQEEDIDRSLPGSPSDIYYTRSIDSGQTFMGPQSGGPWDNITNSLYNSQMPTISCTLDSYYGNRPLDYTLPNSGYNSDDVHVAYNEDTWWGGINIFYLRSFNDGGTWAAPQNVSIPTGGENDGYPNIAVDMLDNAHIVFMRNVTPHEPPPVYIPGLNPANANSFPGPDPGMYASRFNLVIHWSNNPNPVPPIPWPFWDSDQEFPTVAMDRDQNLNVNWQDYFWDYSDYEIIRVTNVNGTAPSWPLVNPVYGNWSYWKDDSRDMDNDDLFPNLAHKKVSMYMSPNNTAGFTEIWTKILGHGQAAAIAPFSKFMIMLNNLVRDPLIY